VSAIVSKMGLELLLPSIGVKVNGQYCWDILRGNKMLDAINASFMTILSFSMTVHRRVKILNFLFPDLWPHNSLEVNYEI